MEMYRCINCMCELKSDECVCPACGYDLRDYEQPANALISNSIIGGRYLIGRVMGQGGFGITYVGYDLKLGLKVAVKEYFPGNYADRNNRVSSDLVWGSGEMDAEKWRRGIGRFLSEARKMALLDALPGIVRVRDSFEENQTAYIVMDFAEGMTLKNYVKKNGSLPYRTALEMLFPVMESLEIMHSRGLVHRDISPDNLMVSGSEEPQIQLLDFGAAVNVTVDVDMKSANAGSSERVVKKGYSAPEQYMEHGNIGAWSDVYAMAAVVYFCVTGREIPDAMQRVLKEADLAMDAVKNRKGQKVLSAALALRGEDRTQSMEQLRLALAQSLPSLRAKTVKKIAAAVVCAAVCVMAFTLSIIKPWLPATKTLGTSNSNMMNGSLYAMIPGKYQYYADADYNLYMSVYDSDDSIFYIEVEEVVAPNVGYVNLGSGKVYFVSYSGESGVNDRIIEMNFDGSEQLVLLNEAEYTRLQYVCYDNGTEMLYYIKVNEDTEDLGLYTLCRYNLSTGREEELLNEGVYWYNIDGKYVYYITYTASQRQSNVTELKRATLNGKNARLLNDTDALAEGFMEDGTLYMMSITEQKLLLYDSSGKRKEEQVDDLVNAAAADASAGEADEAGEPLSESLYGSAVVYAGGVLYYNDSAARELHSLNLDSGEDRMIYSGLSISLLNYAGGSLWGMVEDSDGRYFSFLLNVPSEDGDIVVIGLFYGDYVCTLEDGMLISICGYIGTEAYAVIDWTYWTTVGTYTWDGVLSGGLPDNVVFYVRVLNSELQFKKAGDGSSVTLTSYTANDAVSSSSRDYTNLAIPDNLAQYTVTAIGEGFMTNNTTVERILISENVKTIGSGAFAGCTNLKSVTISSDCAVAEDAFDEGVEINYYE